MFTFLQQILLGSRVLSVCIHNTVSRSNLHAVCHLPTIMVSFVNEAYQRCACRKVRRKRRKNRKIHCGFRGAYAVLNKVVCLLCIYLNDSDFFLCNVTFNSLKLSNNRILKGFCVYDDHISLKISLIIFFLLLRNLCVTMIIPGKWYMSLNRDVKCFRRRGKMGSS